MTNRLAARSVNGPVCRMCQLMPAAPSLFLTASLTPIGISLLNSSLSPRGLYSPFLRPLLLIPMFAVGKFLL